MERLGRPGGASLQKWRNRSSRMSQTQKRGRELRTSGRSRWRSLLGGLFTGNRNGVRVCDWHGSVSDGWVEHQIRGTGLYNALGNRPAIASFPPDCVATAGLENRSGVYVYDFHSVYSRRRGARKEGYPFAVLGLRPAAHHSQGVTSKTVKVGQNRLSRPDGSDGSGDVEMGGEGITCCEVPRICPRRRR